MTVVSLSESLVGIDQDSFSFILKGLSFDQKETQSK